MGGYTGCGGDYSWRVPFSTGLTGTPICACIILLPYIILHSPGDRHRVFTKHITKLSIPNACVSDFRPNSTCLRRSRKRLGIHVWHQNVLVPFGWSLYFSSSYRVSASHIELFYLKSLFDVHPMMFFWPCFFYRKYHRSTLARDLDEKHIDPQYMTLKQLACPRTTMKGNYTYLPREITAAARLTFNYMTSSFISPTLLYVSFMYPDIIFGGKWKLKSRAY